MPAPALARNARPSQSLPITDREIVHLGRNVLQSEARAILRTVGRLDRSFVLAARILWELRGSVIVTGVGKAGLVGQKLAATFASTGTRAHFLHPSEAMHGDLGRIGPRDSLLAISYSGESSEVTQLLPTLAFRRVPMIAITQSRHTTVGRAANTVLEVGPVAEACLLGLAPTSSTAAMLALGDALALVVSRLRGFQPEDFAAFHPGGSLGKRLSRVDEHMRRLGACRLAPQVATIREVLISCSKPGRRSGAIMLTDDTGRLSGIFTDSDLTRLFEQRREAALDDPIENVMSRSPSAVTSGALLEDALAEMARRKISELPVVDAKHRPIGMLDVTDVVESAANLSQPEPTDQKARAGVPHVRIFPNQDDPRSA